jgi:hypothetical protein
MANSGWKQAMDAEYSALQKNQTWDLAPPMQGINHINSKWVYKLKRKANGFVDRLKAMLVATGSSKDMVLILLIPSALL